MPLKSCYCIDNQAGKPCAARGGFCGFSQKSFRVARNVQQNEGLKGMI